MFAIVMKEKIIGRWNRLKDTYRRYRFRGFAGWCMVRVLAKLGIRLRIMYYYAKRLDSATDGRGMREYKELGVNGNEKCTDFGNWECTDFGNNNAPISVTTIHNFR